MKTSRQKAKLPSFASFKSGPPPEGAMFRVSLLALNNQIKKIPHRVAQQLVF